MKPKNLCLIFSAEAVVCAVVASLSLSGGDLVAGIMAFPFEQIGNLLRALSLSGTVGNIAAVIVYCALCLAPAVYLAVRVKKRAARAEDGLLALLSVLLFVSLYMMINPADIARHFGAGELAPFNKVMLGATLYSTAVGYVLLRVLRVFAKSGADSMLRHLKLLLCLVCAVLVYAISGAGTVRLINAFAQLEAGNTGAGNELSLSYAFIVLQFIVDYLPYALNIVIVFSGMGLIEALTQGQYGDNVVPSAKRTARLCRIAVVVIMLSQIAVNALQLALGSLVRASHYSLSIPLLPTVFVLAAMLLAHYFEQSRALKDDSDMII